MLVHTKYESKKTPTLVCFLVGGLLVAAGKWFPVLSGIGLVIALAGSANHLYWVWREIKEGN